MPRSAGRVLAIPALVTVLLAGPLACSLLTSLDGLTDGAATADGAVPGTEGGANEEAGRDGSTGRDGGTTADGAPTNAATAYFDAVLADGPIAFFHFDETNGPTAKSVVGNVTGTYQGSFTFGSESAVGSGDTSVTFDGTSTRIDFGDVFAFPGTASYSIECWAKPTLSGDTRFLFNRRTSAVPFEGYTVYFGTDYFLFARETGGAEFGYASLSAGPALGVWTHVVATFDGAATTLYLNGKQVGQNAGAGTATAQGAGSFVVGDHTPGQFNKLSGQVDELSVYDKALTAAQVLTHFNSVKR